MLVAWDEHYFIINGIHLMESIKWQFRLFEEKLPTQGGDIIIADTATKETNHSDNDRSRGHTTTLTSACRTKSETM